MLEPYCDQLACGKYGSATSVKYHTFTEYRREVVTSAVDSVRMFYSFLGLLMAHFPLIRYLILPQEAGDAPATPLGLRVSMGGSDYLPSAFPAPLNHRLMYIQYMHESMYGTYTNTERAQPRPMLSSPRRLRPAISRYQLRGAILDVGEAASKRSVRWDVTLFGSSSSPQIKVVIQNGLWRVLCEMHPVRHQLLLRGATLLGIGIAVQLQANVALDLLDGRFAAAPVLSMVVGGVVFFIAFLGCCGALRESRCMLITYASFMLVLMIAKVALAVLIFVHMSDLESSVNQVLNDAFAAQNQEPFNALEAGLQCCGTTGPGAYSNRPLPLTCCASPVSNTCNINDAFSRGCNAVVSDLLETYTVVIGAVTIAVAAVELVAVVFALCLSNHAANKNRRGRY
ncbi:23 kDa integral membrane protein [Eumeta japonica]|uniref:23 kDa integral membrane protein n=1 Tax=Eumeta variegata TaxID=151549 RepID=A0A4C1V508_EUMVA|nr:23 kDa integral membrane protein [Eumeta japonica]